MSTRPLRTPIPAALLAVALAACGGGEGAPGAAGPVYTSEVESVSQWMREGGADVDSADLVATPNPQGEGVLVYSRSADPASGEERAAWVVVDSQVVPLNRASRRATPGLPARDDERTWKRIGIRRGEDGSDADLRDILPVPPPEPAAAREAAPAAPAREGDSSGARPAPVRPKPPVGPRDTLRIPAGGAPPARRDSAAKGAPSREPRDTIRIPAGSAGGDSSRRPAGPAVPDTTPPAAVPLPLP